METITAGISAGYKWRLGIIGLACLAFAAWFFYDGAVAYPHQQRGYRVLEQLRVTHPTDWNERWPSIATENGWKDQPSEVSDTDIMTQYIMGALVLPIGLLFGASFVRAHWRKIVMDDRGVRAGGGRDATWDAIRSIDKTRWKSKGIAVVRYDDDGVEKRLTLDDWKFERAPITRMVAEVDTRLGDDPARVLEGEGTEAQQEARELSS